MAADWFGAGLSQASVAGRGGSVGAYLRFGLEDSLDPLAAKLVLAGGVLAGLLLAADWLVIGCARAVWKFLRGLWRAAVWGNDRVADGSEKVLTGLGTAAKVVGHGATGLAKAAKAAIPAVPVRKVAAATSVSTNTPAPAASPLALAAEPANHDDIPIHVHTEHVPTPVTLFRPDAAGRSARRRPITNCRR